MMKIKIFLMLWLGAMLQQSMAAEHSLRRMRKFVEVSDLGGDSGTAGNPPESDQKTFLDTSIGQSEMHRILEDTEQSLSRRLKTGTEGITRTGSHATFSETKTARDELYRMLREEEDLSESRQLQFFSMGSENEPILSSRQQTIRSKCGMTEQDRSTRLFGILSEISDPEELSNSRSERHEAFDWLDQVDEAIVCPSTNRVAQRYLAALLYFTLGGSGWKNCGDASETCEVSDEDHIFQNVRWLSEEHECRWFGMYCESNTHPDSADETGMLTDIDLDDNNLVGYLPIELYGTSSLQTIIMDGNKLKGSIPADIARLKSLKTFDLDDNQLTGTLPEEFFSLTSLEVVDLNSNKFTGTLPSQIRNLVNIRFLQLDYNYLSGDLPAQDILELENIFALTLESNDFTGSLEDICEVIDKRRENYEIYLQYLQTDCAGNSPDVECSCCSECF